MTQFVNPKHELVKLARIVDWAGFEEVFGDAYCPDDGRPGIRTHLMFALYYLKYTYNLSDAAVVAGWVENPYWQFFSGIKFFQHEPPIDPSSMTRWRKRIGEAGTEKLLEETIRSGLIMKAVQPTLIDSAYSYMLPQKLFLTPKGTC